MIMIIDEISISIINLLISNIKLTCIVKKKLEETMGTFGQH